MFSGDLAAIRTALETAAGASTSANDTETGEWKRIAAAAEVLAGASTSANETVLGWMKRSAVALESIAGTSGAEENEGYYGYLTRIVDALEVQAGAVTSGSLEARAVVAAQNAVFSFTFVNAEAEAYVAAMTVEPDDTRKGLIDDLVGGLKTDGIWAKLDWLCLLAAHDAQAARLNAKNPAKSLALVNAPTFTVDRGYQGNGTTSYLDFGELPNAVGNTYAQDSACAGAWCNQQGASSGLFPHFGGAATATAIIRARNTAGNETFLFNDGTASTFQANTGSRVGHRAASRTSSLIKRGFFNGVRVADLSVASTAVPSGNASLLRATTAFADDRLAAGYLGSGLTDAEAGNMHTRLNTFLTAIGAN